MRSYLITILLFLALVSCDSPTAPDCLKSGGDITTETRNISEFLELEINGDFQVIIRDATTQSLEIEGPKNLLEKIVTEVYDNTLIVTNNNTCNWVRSYDLPKVYISSPNITRIKQNGAGLVKSANTITYPDIQLVTVENSGDYELSFDNERVRISNNDLSNFYFSGRTDLLFVGFYAGDGRCECAELEADRVRVFQRSSNDMIVNAVNKLEGRIISTGNVIYTGQEPAEIDISIEGRGDLIDNTN